MSESRIFDELVEEKKCLEEEDNLLLIRIMLSFVSFVFILK